MYFSHLRLENWRNFLHVDVKLKSRVFVVGPNASGKSNFLDAFRFLKDVADPRGGFQYAVVRRRGVSQLRSLHARRYPNVVIDASVSEDNSRSGARPEWRYVLEFTQNNQRVATISREHVYRNGRLILERPNSADNRDPNRLTQTYLEQVNANRSFRDLADFFSQLRYLHLIPQLVRQRILPDDVRLQPYGNTFLETIARTPERIRDSRLGRIQEALKVAVPQLKGLEMHRDEAGAPHLRGLYEHWRPNAGWQSEEEFSDGTLRLLALLWSMLDGTAPLILEEPELSLHGAVVRHIPSLMFKLTRRTGRQILLSTHSVDMLSDPGIDASEAVVLVPTGADTKAQVADKLSQVKPLLEGGLTVAEAVLPLTAPANAAQLSLFRS
jgi:predicted ATPase